MRLTQIVRLVYLWLNTTSTVRQMAAMTGLGTPTVLDWMNFCRNVCTVSLDKSPKMVGTNSHPVQIDESYHAGRRKYNRGRLNKGDKLKSTESNHDREQQNIGGPSSASDEASGPWVFGACDSANHVRFKLVDDRRADTLIPIICNWVESGSTIISDEWRAYSRLRDYGFEHNTVCHKNEFLNSDGFHTQKIERAWVETKAYLKRARGGGALLQSHLDEISWRKYRSNHPQGLLAAFFEDVNSYFHVV